MFKILFLTGLFSFSALAGIVRINKEEATLIKELNQQGFKLDTTSLIVLNGSASKKKLPNNSRYRVTFSCVHKDKIDSCYLSGLTMKQVDK